MTSGPLPQISFAGLPSTPSRHAIVGLASVPCLHWPSRPLRKAVVIAEVGRTFEIKGVSMCSPEPRSLPLLPPRPSPPPARLLQTAEFRKAIRDCCLVKCRLSSTLGRAQDSNALSVSLISISIIERRRFNQSFRNCQFLSLLPTVRDE
jgi:hypothetical protein